MLQGNNSKNMLGNLLKAIWWERNINTALTMTTKINHVGLNIFCATKQDMTEKRGKDKTKIIYITIFPLVSFMAQKSLSDFRFSPKENDVK